MRVRGPVEPVAHLPRHQLLREVRRRTRPTPGVIVWCRRITVIVLVVGYASH